MSDCPSWRVSRKSSAVLAILAPGQGAQTPGFLASWLTDDAARAQLQALSAVAELDLAQLGTDADADTIRQTDIAQPLLVAAGVVAADPLSSSRSRVRTLAAMSR